MKNLPAHFPKQQNLRHNQIESICGKKGSQIDICLLQGRNHKVGKRRRKMLFTRISSFSRVVFKRLHLHSHQKFGLYGRLKFNFNLPTFSNQRIQAFDNPDEVKITEYVVEKGDKTGKKQFLLPLVTSLFSFSIMLGKSTDLKEEKENE